jgi:hypothetical protein
MRSRSPKATKPQRKDFFPLSRVAATLAREGWRVRQHHVRHAIAIGAMDAPPLRGGWRLFSPRHIDQLRDYLTHHARQAQGGAE